MTGFFCSQKVEPSSEMFHKIKWHKEEKKKAINVQWKGETWAFSAPICNNLHVLTTDSVLMMKNITLIFKVQISFRFAWCFQFLQRLQNRNMCEVKQSTIVSYFNSAATDDKPWPLTSRLADIGYFGGLGMLKT